MVGFVHGPGSQRLSGDLMSSESSAWVPVGPRHAVREGQEVALCDRLVVPTGDEWWSVGGDSCPECTVRADALGSE